MPGIPNFLLNPALLYAALLWGTIGTGFCIYGKKQGAAIPLVGGLILIVISCLIPSALWMSLASMGLIGAMTWLIKAGY